MATVNRPPEGVLKQGYIFVECPDLEPKEYFGVVTQSFLILNRSEDNAVTGFPDMVIDLKNSLTSAAPPLGEEYQHLYKKQYSQRVTGSKSESKDADVLQKACRFTIVFPDETKNVNITCPSENEKEEWSLVLLTSAALAIPPSAFTIPDIESSLVLKPRSDSESKEERPSHYSVPKSLEDDFFDLQPSPELCESVQKKELSPATTNPLTSVNDAHSQANELLAKEQRALSKKKRAQLKALEAENAISSVSTFITECKELRTRLEEALKQVLRDTDLLSAKSIETRKEINRTKRELKETKCKLEGIRTQVKSLFVDRDESGESVAFQIDCDAVRDSVINRFVLSCLSSLSEIYYKISRNDEVQSSTDTPDSGPSWSEVNQSLWVSLATQMLVADEYFERLRILEFKSLPYPLDTEECKKYEASTSQRDVGMQADRINRDIWDWRKTLRLMVEKGYELPAVDPETFFSLLSNGEDSDILEFAPPKLRCIHLVDVMRIAQVLFSVFQRKVESIEYLSRIQELALDGSQLFETLSK